MSKRNTRKRTRTLAELSEPDSESDESTVKSKSNTKSKSPTKKNGSKSSTKSPQSKTKTKSKSKYSSDSSDSELEDDDIGINQLNLKTQTKTKKKSNSTSNSNSSSNSPSKNKSESKAIKNAFDMLGAPPRKKSRRLASVQQKKDAEFASEFDYVIKEHETVILVYPRKFEARPKIASFDMDSTLVCPKGKLKFPRNRSDWKWQFASVPSKLKSLYKDGYRIVIFTNQAGIEKGKQYAGDITGKIIDLSNELGIPITGMISTHKDYWRKPNTFMFDYLVDNLHNNGGSHNSSSNTKTKSNDEEKSIEVDFENSFYCGDAAGRPAGWNGDKKCKRDFSVSDRKFAANIGLKFCTPEPLFLKHNECKNFDWRALDPKKYLKENPEANYGSLEKWFHGGLPIAKKNLDMVIMVGPPGSGKSTIATKYLQEEGYVWVNRDTLKTQAKCQKLADTALTQGKSVVIDNTNPNSLAREAYVDIGLKHKANIRVFFMNVEKDLAEHMNLVREKMTDGNRKRIPGLVFNMFYKKVREDGKPSLDEGVNEVCTIDLIPKFENDQNRKWFLEWN